MGRHELGTALYAGLLFTVLGLVAWATGEPFVFPSLGPSAFVLAYDRRGGRATGTAVVGSHVIGALAGLLSYTLLGGGVVLTGTLAPSSMAGLRLAISGICSVTLTSWGMMLTDTRHAPACATTLIVSLGLLSSPSAVATIVTSVTVLVVVHLFVLRGFEEAVGESLA